MMRKRRIEDHLDILFMILNKVPVKSLLRFRCLSKFWCATIDDLEFVDLHHKVSQTRPDGVGILVVKENHTSLQYEIYILDMEGDGGAPVHLLNVPYAAIPVIRSLPGKKDEYGSVLNSVNGLVKFHNVLFNPITAKKLIAVPSLRMPPVQPGHPVRFRSQIFLGFDIYKKRYKILCKITIQGPNFNPHIEYTCVEYHILTLGTDSSWRVMDSIPNVLPTINNFTSCCTGGVMYLLERNVWGTYVLVAFDLRHENFRIIALPKEDNYANYHLIEVRNRLAIIDHSVSTIWILREKSWEMHSFNYEADYMHIRFQPIGSSPSGEILLLNECVRFRFIPRLFCYNLETRSFRRILANLPNIFQCKVYCTTHVECLDRLKIQNRSFITEGVEEEEEEEKQGEKDVGVCAKVPVLSDPIGEVASKEDLEPGCIQK